MTIETELSKFVDIMVDDILGKLEGSHPLFERIEVPDKPSKIMVLGTLGDKSTDYSTQRPNQERTLSSVKNNSLSVKFLTDKEGKLGIVPTFSLYYRVYPTFQEQTEYTEKNYETVPEKVEIARIWKRKDITLDELIFNITEETHEKEIDFTYMIQSILGDDIFTGGKEITSESLKDEKSYLTEIDALKTNITPSFDWKAKIQIKKELFRQDGKQLRLLTVRFINETDESNSYETFLFNSHLQINLQELDIQPFKHRYEYEGFEYHYETLLRCLNCHATYNEQNGVISTQHYSKFSQKKLIPRTTINGIKFNFEDLSRDDDLKSLHNLRETIEKGINSWKADPAYPNDPKYKKNLDHLESLKNRFEEGIELLKTNKTALRAFQLLNTTFKQASGYEGWRIFQIFFIVGLIPDIIDKTKRRGICEVLHVDTGGGKSEAYFGCVIFSAFWDRLTGKKLGTTAITKFPLRMLSVQQLQRIASLMIWAEKIRKNEGIEGEPFSVAYFVGSSEDFPRHTKNIIKEIEASKKKGIEQKGKIIENCPLCKGDVILDFKENERYIVHRCKSCNEEFLLFYTDEEIYRFLPTFIISTVDKLAGIAMNRRLKNVFGGKIDQCPKGHGFIPHNDFCEVETTEGRCEETGDLYEMDFETGPTLVIQDEMHLIREGFGTINSHFESLLETLQKKLSGYGFKNITMTATMTGAPEQIKHLYHKEINVFPGESIKERGVDDIFFEYELDENSNPVEQRKLVGLKPNLRDNQFSSLLTLKYLSEFIKTVESDLPSFSKKHGFDGDKLGGILELYKNNLTYHNKKSDVHSMSYYLEAVVNSKLKEYKIKSKVLTGDNTLDDIKELIHLVETYFSKPENKKRILSVFATSIVSHGVDISKWNFMIFQGMPRSTAEYIQALSRVGRKYPGAVFVWFYPNRARDLSYYQGFKEYHEILQHKVENVPLSRWAKLGLQQTFTSIFNAAILNYFSDVIGEPLYKVPKVNEIFSLPANREQLIEFIQEAYVTDSKMTGSSYFKNRIPDEVEKRLNYLARYGGSDVHFFPNALRDCEDKYFRTQYGMRGIQDEVLLKPSDFDISVHRSISR
jgi:hypothetical protein